MKNKDSIVYLRQKPLMDAYRENPELAKITDLATIEGTELNDPFHTTVFINENLKEPFSVGVHEAVGGLHDFPNPGDILCASLAACYESTLRMISNRLGVVLKKTKVTAKGHVDVQGTLMLDATVPVGFQKFEVDVEVAVDESTPENMVNILLQATKHCCIVIQTIKQGTPVDVNVEVLSYKENA